MTRYISLAEYLWLAEQVTGIDAPVLAKASRLELADSALHAPAAGFGDQEFYPDLIDKASVLTLPAHLEPSFARREQARRVGEPPSLPGPERNRLESRSTRH